MFWTIVGAIAFVIMVAAIIQQFETLVGWLLAGFFMLSLLAGFVLLLIIFWEYVGPIVIVLALWVGIGTPIVYRDKIPVLKHIDAVADAVKAKVKPGHIYAAIILGCILAIFLLY